MKRCALLSVTNKAGLAEFAKTLVAGGYELLSTGGTATTLREAGLKVTDVSAYTGVPEMFRGRVKTLHHKIYAGILAGVAVDEDMAKLTELGWDRVGIVVVNLYDFASAVRRGAGLSEVIENIDIGGPSLLRAAAKNYIGPMVVCDPADYPEMTKWVGHRDGAPYLLRLKLALKVFEHTAKYDAMVADYLRAKVAEFEKMGS